MLNAIKSETVKLFSLRSTYVYAFFLFASLAGFTFVGLFVMEDGKVWNFEDILMGAPLFLLIAVAFIGNSVGAAHSDHMTAHAFLTQKSRYQWLAAFGIVAGGFLFALGAIGIALSMGMIAIFPGMELSTELSHLLFTLAAQVLLYSVVAAGLGVLTRSRVIASVVPLAWMLVVEPLVQMGASAIEAVRPLWLALSPMERISQVANVIADVPVSATGWNLDVAQPTWFNIAQPLAWLVAFAVAAFVVNQRRDVR